jgi:putative endonuclease
LDFSKAEIDISLPKKKIPLLLAKPASLEFGLPQDFVKPKKIQLLVKAVDVNEKT